ncbi:MAG: VPA1262 family N-terminal domain-containing protein [Spirochaetota bacterium]
MLYEIKFYATHKRQDGANFPLLSVYLDQPTIETGIPASHRRMKTSNGIELAFSVLPITQNELDQVKSSNSFHQSYQLGYKGSHEIGSPINKASCAVHAYHGKEDHFVYDLASFMELTGSAADQLRLINELKAINGFFKSTLWIDCETTGILPGTHVRIESLPAVLLDTEFRKSKSRRRNLSVWMPNFAEGAAINILVQFKNASQVIFSRLYSYANGAAIQNIEIPDEVEPFSDFKLEIFSGDTDGSSKLIHQYSSVLTRSFQINMGVGGPLISIRNRFEKTQLDKGISLQRMYSMQTSRGGGYTEDPWVERGRAYASLTKGADPKYRKSKLLLVSDKEEFVKYVGQLTTGASQIIIVDPYFDPAGFESYLVAIGLKKIKTLIYTTDPAKKVRENLPKTEPVPAIEDWVDSIFQILPGSEVCIMEPNAFHDRYFITQQADEMQTVYNISNSWNGALVSQDVYICELERSDALQVLGKIERLNIGDGSRFGEKNAKSTPIGRHAGSSEIYSSREEVEKDLSALEHQAITANALIPLLFGIANLYYTSDYQLPPASLDNLSTRLRALNSAELDSIWSEIWSKANKIIQERISQSGYKTQSESFVARLQFPIGQSEAAEHWDRWGSPNVYSTDTEFSYHIRYVFALLLVLLPESVFAAFKKQDDFPAIFAEMIWHHADDIIGGYDDWQKRLTHLLSVMPEWRYPRLHAYHDRRPRDTLQQLSKDYVSLYVLLNEIWTNLELNELEIAFIRANIARQYDQAEHQKFDGSLERMSEEDRNSWRQQEIAYLKSVSESSRLWYIQQRFGPHLDINTGILIDLLQDGIDTQSKTISHSLLRNLSLTYKGLGKLLISAFNLGEMSKPFEDLRGDYSPLAYGRAARVYLARMLAMRFETTNPVKLLKTTTPPISTFFNHQADLNEIQEYYREIELIFHAMHQFTSEFPATPIPGIPDIQAVLKVSFQYLRGCWNYHDADFYHYSIWIAKSFVHFSNSDELLRDFSMLITAAKPRTVLLVGIKNPTQDDLTQIERGFVWITKDAEGWTWTLTALVIFVRTWVDAGCSLATRVVIQRILAYALQKANSSEPKTGASGLIERIIRTEQAGTVTEEFQILEAEFGLKSTFGK